VTNEKLKPDDLMGATIVGYGWSENLNELQLKLKDGRLVILYANGATNDKRFRVIAWLEVQTNTHTDTIYREHREKLL